MTEQQRVKLEELNELERFIERVNDLNFPDNLTDEQVIDGLRLYARFKDGAKADENIDLDTELLYCGFLKWKDNPFIEFYENSKTNIMNSGPLIERINQVRAHIRSNWFTDK